MVAEGIFYSAKNLKKNKEEPATRGLWLTVNIVQMCAWHTSNEKPVIIISHYILEIEIC